MNVAIIHHHLNHSGVTRVISHHLRALHANQASAPQYQVAVVYGGRREGWSDMATGEFSPSDVALSEVAELDYDAGYSAQPLLLAAALQRALDGLGFGPNETILHCHNHALGKNLSLPGALLELAKVGYRLVLQIHDFVEDFRPGNYQRLLWSSTALSPSGLPAQLYPQAAHIHYAVLNRRDHELLRLAGVQPTRLHFLPNPVVDPSPLPGKAATRRHLERHCGIPTNNRLVLYPVRGIRRKNLGEALLWSALAGADTHIAFTLPPLNPLEQSNYQRWKRIAADQGLPCVFEIDGLARLDYKSYIAASDLILTTSVSEGFGLVFLESWLASRRLIGRDLPEITADFVAHGIRLDNLRASLRVPLGWIGETKFRESTSAAYLEALELYNQPRPPAATVSEEIHSLIDDGLVDFAALVRPFQEQVIGELWADTERRAQLLALNPWIGDALTVEGRDHSIIDRNVELIRQHYSLECCSHRLRGIYRAVFTSAQESEISAPPHGERILGSFLSLSRFCPLYVDR